LASIPRSSSLAPVLASSDTRGVDEKVGAEMNVIKDVTFEGTILNQIKKTIEFIETQVREHTFLGTTCPSS
jgi:hypothetical protein